MQFHSVHITLKSSPNLSIFLIHNYHAAFYNITFNGSITKLGAINDKNRNLQTEKRSKEEPPKPFIDGPILDRYS